MQSQNPLTLMIHDLNPWGGQDRSMLEIAWQLNQSFPLEIHSFSLEGGKQWQNMRHIKYHARIKRPIIFKYLNYQLGSFRRLQNTQPGLIQSTGTASLKSDVVQVQFIHHSWQKLVDEMPVDKKESVNPLLAIYRKALNYYKKFLERNLYTPEKKYIAISHGIKKELIENFNIPSENIETIYHGVDPDHFTPIWENKQADSQRQNIRQQYNIAKNDFVLLHVGALNSRKGLFKSIQVLSFLKKNGFDNIKLLAVGQGDKNVLKDLARNWHVEDRLILASHSQDIRSFYWAADSFFFPTFYEPFGLVILEAMACGLPTIVSQRAGGAELIDDGVNGIIFDPKDSPETIANRIVPIIKSSEYAHKIAENARHTAVANNWNHVGAQYRNFYTELLAGKS